MSSHTHACTEATSQTPRSWNQRPIHLCWYQSARSRACIDISIAGHTCCTYIHSCRRICGKLGWWWLFNWLFGVRRRWWVRWRRWKIERSRGGFVHACMHIMSQTIIRDISHVQSWKEEQPTVQSVEAKVEDTLKMEDPPTASPAAAGRNPYRCMFVCSSVAAGSGCTPPPVPSSILPRITSTHAYIYTYRGGSSVHFEQMCSKEPPLKNCRAQTSWQSSWSLMMKSSQTSWQSWNCWKSLVSLRTCWLKGLKPWRFPRPMDLRDMLVRMVCHMRAARIQGWYGSVLCRKHLH